MKRIGVELSPEERKLEGKALMKKIFQKLHPKRKDLRSWRR